MEKYSLLKRDENSRGLLKVSPLTAAIAAALAYAPAPPVAVAHTDDSHEAAVDLPHCDVTRSRPGPADHERALPAAALIRGDRDS